MDYTWNSATTDDDAAASAAHRKVGRIECVWSVSWSFKNTSETKVVAENSATTFFFVGNDVAPLTQNDRLICLHIVFNRYSFDLEYVVNLQKYPPKN